MRSNGLTEKQALFVQEYLIDLNGTQAAIRAGYSSETAASQASTLLKVPKVSEAIARVKAERSARIGLRQDRVLEELSSIAFAKLTDFAYWGANGFTLIESSELEDSRPVSGVKVKRTIVTDPNGYQTERIEHEISLLDKHKALEKLGIHIGMFKQRHEHVIEQRQRLEELAKRYGLDPEQVDQVWQTAVELAEAEEQ